MKNKGFTLIELLAVIVILAIIALIAVPIILNIINDAKEQANKRSVELYGKAIENAIAKAQLNNNQIPAGELSSAFLETVQYEGTEVTCTTNMLYEDGKIYLAGCTINGKGPYTYGEEQTSVTRYYSWTGARIGENLPGDAATTTPPGKYVYLGYDAEDGTNGTIITAAYVCFLRNNNQYCVKQYSTTDDYNAAVDEMKTAFEDVLETDACHIFNDSAGCNYDNIDFVIGKETSRIDLTIKYNGEYQCSYEGDYNWCEEK